MAIEFLTPVGRLVQGDAFTASQKKDDNGKPVFKEDGVTPVMQYYVAIAIAKNSPEWPAFYAQLVNEARTGYPQYFDPATGQCRVATFAFKVTDGDGVDKYGRPNSQKEGFAGHWIVKFTTQIAPRVMHKGQYLTDTNAIKRGYYVRVYGSAKANIGAKSPGLYMNHQGVELIGYGPEIVGGADVAEKFAAPVGVLPAGMSAVPLAPTAPTAPAGAGFPVAGALPTPPGAPALPTPPGAAPQLPSTPGALPTPPGAGPTPPAPVFTMTALANGATREQLLQGGWTDEMLIQQGLMTKSAPPPNPGFVAAAAAGIPTPPSAPALSTPPAPVQTGPRMTAAANGASREQLIAAGWTDATLIAHGLMVA